eukprot:8524383-Prorocentrum_lima.AAC.1
MLLRLARLGSVGRGPKRLRSEGAARMSSVRCTGMGIVGSRSQADEALAAPCAQLESHEYPWIWGETLVGGRPAAH